MAVEQDAKQIANGLNIGNHKFVNKLSDGIIAAIQSKVSELNLVPMGRQESGSTIKIKLVGEIYTEDVEATTKSVDGVMQQLRNEYNLLSQIK